MNTGAIIVWGFVWGSGCGAYVRTFMSYILSILQYSPARLTIVEAFMSVGAFFRWDLGLMLEDLCPTYTVRVNSTTLSIS